MSMTMRVTMELLSDAIFGSGFSVPGGEDVAVCRDAQGYPYLKGSTLKGLLRESLENLSAWTGAGSADTEALLGVSGWDGTGEARRVHLTALTLEAPPADPEDCFALRTFTSLEGGIVKTGTLRTASCVRRGLRFTGELTCAEEDAGLLQDALAGVKWAGTLRSRGFGRVRLTAEAAASPAGRNEPVTGRCIHYRLRTKTPVLITDLSRSGENSYETRGYIPGSAVRGMVIGALASRDPDWFQAHKAALLGGEARFLDAVPAPEQAAVLPSIRGFYETKEETGLESVVTDGVFTPGKKRAKLGAFCALEGGTIRYWSAETDGAMRIQRNVAAGEDTRPFQTRYLSAGQDFSGYICLEDEALAEKISAVFAGTVWLGADRFEGFGQCAVTALEAVDAPAWTAAYGVEAPAETLYLLAVSPLAMLDRWGEPCGLDTETLAKKLGVDRVEVRYCSTALAEFGGYNRTWKCRAPAVRMYDRGSVFQLACSGAPALERLRAVQREGLGIRRSEGFGQVLFLRAGLLESLKDKAAVKRPQADAAASRVRDAKYRWVMDKAADIQESGLSPSQVGTIQALCEQAMSNGGGTAALYAHLERNLNGRGARHGVRFVKIDRLIRQVLDQPLEQTLGVPGCGDDRLGLLCLLFDYSRKGREKEGM